MGLSSYLPTSAIAKPGVCTSSTRPASPYEGQVIYETDTDKTLVWNGSAWVYLSTSTAGDVGLVKVVPTSVVNATLSATGTVTLGSAITSVEIIGAFSSSYDAYRIVAANVTATQESSLRLQFGNSSGYSTAGYYGALVYYDGALATTGNYAWTNAASGLCGAHGNTIGLSLDCDIINPYSARMTGYINAAYMRYNYYGNSSGYHNQTTSYDRVKLFPELGTLTGGTITVYGYRS